MVHTSNTKPDEPPKLIFTLFKVRPPPPFVSRRSDRTHPPLIFVHIQRHPTPIHPLSHAKFLWKNSRNHFLTLSKLWYIIFLMLTTQILVFRAIFRKRGKIRFRSAICAHCAPLWKSRVFRSALHPKVRHLASMQSSRKQSKFKHDYNAAL